MVFTLLVTVAAFIAGVLVERNNLSVGGVLLTVKKVAVEIYDAIVNLIHRV